MKVQKLIIATIMAFSFLSCTSGVRRADIPNSANSTEEIAKLDRGIAQAYSDQVDVLANMELELSEKNLKKAKNDLADGDDHEKVIKSIATSKGYLDEANRLANQRRNKATAILDSRRKAIAAGAKVYTPTAKQMTKVDRDVVSYSEKFEKLTAKDVTVLQKQYLDIENEAIQNRHLGRAKSLIDNAKGASRHAPIAFKQAELDVRSAEELIKANRNSPEMYSQQVAKADQSAIYLTAILAETQNGKVKEEVARKMVDQNRRLEQLTAELNQAADRQNELSSENSELSSTVSGQNDELRQANQTVQLQKSLAEAQQQFSDDEAEVFQQGNNIVIRLKQIKFPSGRATLPSGAVPLLEKVRGVAQELGPQTVRIEGHTDAIGTESLNKALSEERAETIADYFSQNGIDRSKMETVGVGFEKPLTTNKTKEGRAQNRRVDIIITPDSSITE